MSRQNVPFLSFNKGLISPKALARVDVERTRLSAERFENFLPKTQGALTIRPGTKWFGSSLRDTGAEYLEFVASTDDVALPELTHEKMRLWLGSDAHALGLLSRPKVDTSLGLSDTGWANTSSGGAFATLAVDAIPDMTAATTAGVTISASSENIIDTFSGQNLAAWRAADDDGSTSFMDTGFFSSSSLPTWWKVDFGAGNTKAIHSYSIRASFDSTALPNAPKAWTLECNDVDTGAGWSVVDTRSGQTGWAVSEKRSFARLDTDTGTVEALRYWRLNFSAIDGGGPYGNALALTEIEMFTAAAAQQVKLSSGRRILNATSVGALARAEKRVMVSDTGTEHSLAIYVERGPVTLRVGSSQRDDDYIRETGLGTGYHNLAFTPQVNFWVTLQSDLLVDRIVGSLAIGDSGTVEIVAPWGVNDLGNVRYDQSADVVYVDCNGVRPSKIERRGTGRSWSVVDYAPTDGPFLPAPSSSAKLSVSHFFGNTTLNADIPCFRSDQVGALIRIFHEGQGGQWRLGALNAKTDAIEITGITDTGTTPTDDTGYSDRNITFDVSGTYVGRIQIEKSVSVDAESGFKPISNNIGTPSDTGTFFLKLIDRDDNVKVRYRARMLSYTSGVAVVKVRYRYGGVTGIGRITGFNSNTNVDLEVLSRFSDTGPSDNWQEGYWSTDRGFPTALALTGGRLMHAQGGSIFASVSDDYENFDDATLGDAGPIIRTLGSGPVDSIRYLVALLRPIIGTAGAELTVRSSSLDESLTPDNASVGAFGTQGAANLRALRLDGRAVFVQRSGQRLFMVGPSQGSGFGEYESFELTMLVPDLLAAGVVSIAVQRQPDTRLHACLSDGTVAILTYEPSEEVVCWSMWSTDGAVERVMCLPGISEDAVYYHIRRTINGQTRRYLEKWAKESECVGDTGLTWLMDSARSFTDTGRSAVLVDIAPHLVGEPVVVWSDDTGSIPGVDRSPDVGGVQTTFTPDTGGDVTLGVAVHHAVAGLPIPQPTWISTKLAYAAQLGTALVQQKRLPQLGLILHNTQASAVFFGTDTGHLDPLPRVIEGAVVDADAIHASLDMVAVSMPDKWHPDTRLVLRGKSPRPATILAAVPTVVTSEK